LDRIGGIDPALGQQILDVAIPAVAAPVTRRDHLGTVHDGSIEIEFAYHNGDEAVLKAKRETSSTAC
jgi:hypothetical protein